MLFAERYKCTVNCFFAAAQTLLAYVSNVVLLKLTVG